MIRIAFFDIDGTLIRTGGAGQRAFALAGEAAFGIPNGTGHMRFAGRTDTSLVREFLTHHGLAPSEEHFQRFFEHYLRLLGPELAGRQGGPCPGVREFLDSMERLALPPRLGLLTGNIRPGAEVKLRHYGLWGRFELGAYGDDSEDRNEIARIAFERARALLGPDLAPEEMLVVGDTVHDVRCGQAVGARVLGVGTGGGTVEELRAAGADWVVRDLREADLAWFVG